MRTIKELTQQVEKKRGANKLLREDIKANNEVIEIALKELFTIVKDDIISFNDSLITDRKDIIKALKARYECNKIENLGLMLYYIDNKLSINLNRVSISQFKTLIKGLKDGYCTKSQINRGLDYKGLISKINKKRAIDKATRLLAE